jgi:hypothetical protein
MDLFTRDELKKLLAEHPSPCVSCFMPSHRGGSPEDPIRWRKHLKEAETQLHRRGLRRIQIADLLAPGWRLLEDAPFWKNQGDGLAGFLAPEFMQIFRLPIAFKDGVTVGNRFTILPLLPLLTDDGSFFVLAVSQNAVRLLQGTRMTINEIGLKDVPHDMAEALATHDRDEPLTFHTRRTSSGAWTTIFEGHGVGIDDAKDDLLRYFQRIDRGLHRVLREEQAPLLLASVDYLRPIYRQANTYPCLLEKGLEGNPDRLGDKELHDQAWPIVEPLFKEARKQATARYQHLADTEHVSSDPKVVVSAAYKGCVETLFVALDQEVWGIFDPNSGQVQRHPDASFGDVNLLDLAAAHTLKHGGTVYAVPCEQVPGHTELAAMFWLRPPKHG